MTRKYFFPRHARFILYGFIVAFLFYSQAQELNWIDCQWHPIIKKWNPVWEGRKFQMQSNSLNLEKKFNLLKNASSQIVWRKVGKCSEHRWTKVLVCSSILSIIYIYTHSSKNWKKRSDPNVIWEQFLMRKKILLDAKICVCFQLPASFTQLWPSLLELDGNILWKKSEDIVQESNYQSSRVDEVIFDMKKKPFRSFSEAILRIVCNLIVEQ